MFNSSGTPSLRTPLLKQLGRPVLLLIPATVVAVYIFSKASEPQIAGRAVRTWAKLANSGDQNALAVLKTQGSNVVPELIRLLNDKDSRIRRTIWASPRKLPTPIKGILSRVVAPPDSGSVQAGAVRALQFIGPESRAAIPVLAERLHDPSHQNRFEAAVALGYIGPEAIPWLCAALESNQQTDRAAIANALAQMGTNSAVAFVSLIKTLHDPDPYVRGAAAIALERVGIPGQDALREIVMHGDSDARCAAAKELGSIYDAPFNAVRALEDMAHDPSAQARQRAIELLGHMQPRRRSVLALWIKASEDRVPEVRMAAVQALANSDSSSDDTIGCFKKCLSDSSPITRECAANALGKRRFASKSALPALAQLQNDQDANVRTAAKQAIAKVQGAP